MGSMLPVLMTLLNVSEHFALAAIPVDTQLARRGFAAVGTADDESSHLFPLGSPDGK